MYRTLPMLLVLLSLCPVNKGIGQEQPDPVRRPPRQREIVVPDLGELVSSPCSEMRVVVIRYQTDRASLERRYPIPSSPTRHARLKHFHTSWRDALKKLDAGRLSEKGRADYQRLRETIDRSLRQLDLQAREQAEVDYLLPFRATIIDLEETRQDMKEVDAAGAARRLTSVVEQIEGMRKSVRTGETPLSKPLATRAAETTARLRQTLKTWFRFYNGYDPVFTWWLADPYPKVDQALQDYGALLKKKSKEVAEEAVKGPTSRKGEDTSHRPTESDVPDLGKLLAFPPSDLADVVRQYQADRFRLSRLASRRLPGSTSCTPERLARVKKFYTDWLQALEKLDFDKLNRPGQIDYLLLRNHAEHELRELELQARARAKVDRLLPFASALSDLERSRRRRDKTDPAEAKALLEKLKSQIADVRKKVNAGEVKVDWLSAGEATREMSRFRRTLRQWASLHKSDGKWSEAVAEALPSAQRALEEYATFLRDKGKVPGPDGSGIAGRPIGREALLVALAGEMIPYTPEELIVIAEKEFAWCEAEMKKASREMGFGADWRQALEKVKTMHVEPGKQPGVIRDLAHEAIAYVNEHGLVTVPPLATETWRMEMMSPQRQLINPFFTGGEVIRVSFPTSTMPYEAKLESMRGNNIPFSRATVHHELIPGHHLQGYMTARYRTHRGVFNTPFWTEGWALYWEMVLYQKGFPRTAADRVGFLFWRMHRCARILFSLGYHLGRLSPQECIDLLVNRVGHERDNATAEVRRSLEGRYPPLYQAAYMLGGLQIRALRQELVDSGKMSERDFHDAILKENRIPIAMVRAMLSGKKLKRDDQRAWRFYGEVGEE